MRILLYEHFLKALGSNNKRPFPCRGCGNDIEVGDWLIITPLKDLLLCSKCNEFIKGNYNFDGNKKRSARI